MAAYFNEIDPGAAAWLRELIKRGLIADGEVDERSIVDVRADDLRGFTQVHCFAGIGVWSHSLRLAGWPDDRPVWTGSCPCQPFSAAGKGDEFADERHLWPAWFRLIRECRPVAVFGEQVASKDALAWLDHVCADLEAEGYAVGAVDSCAAGYGAPHIRQRLYWVADAQGGDWEVPVREWRPDQEVAQPRGRSRSGDPDRFTFIPTADGQSLVMADTDGMGQRGRGTGEAVPEPGAEQRSGRCGAAHFMGDTEDERRPGLQSIEDQSGRSRDDGLGQVSASGNRATNGFWADAVWIPCRDGRARPTEPGTFPLAHGSPARVGRLRGYGNAIVAPQAAEFIRAVMEVE